MSRQRIGFFVIDCLAILAGLVVATPFLLMLAVPFTGGI